jgi:hypothetical protein
MARGARDELELAPPRCLPFAGGQPVAELALQPCRVAGVAGGLEPAAVGMAGSVHDFQVERPSGHRNLRYQHKHTGLDCGRVLMATHAAAAHRGADHRAAQAGRMAAATTDRERLSAAFDQFRSSTALLAKRRPPREANQFGNRAAAARLTEDMTAYLADLAAAIDRGDYDTE